MTRTTARWERRVVSQRVHSPACFKRGQHTNRAIDALDADLVEVTVLAGSRLDSAALRDSPPPTESRVAIVRRGSETIVPNGDTRLAAGDVLLVITPKRCKLAERESWSHSGPASSQ